MSINEINDSIEEIILPEDYQNINDIEKEFDNKLFVDANTQLEGIGNHFDLYNDNMAKSCITITNNSFIKSLKKIRRLSK